MCLVVALVPEGECSHRPGFEVLVCVCAIAGQGAVREAAASKPLFPTQRMGLRGPGQSRQDWWKKGRKRSPGPSGQEQLV